MASVVAAPPQCSGGTEETAGRAGAGAGWWLVATLAPQTGSTGEHGATLSSPAQHSTRHRCSGGAAATAALIQHI